MARHRARMSVVPIWLAVLWLALGQDAIARDPSQEHRGVAAPEADMQAASTAEQARHFTLAATGYRRAVNELGRRDGEYSVALIEPLLGLGRSLIEAGDYDGATQALRKAQFIMHRTNGVDTTKQLGIVDLLRQIHMDKGEPLHANRDAMFSLFLSEHQFGVDNPDLLPAIYKLVSWYIGTGQYDRAGQLLGHASRIITGKFGDSDARLIRVLMLKAKNARLAHFCCSYKYLERARKIAVAHPSIPSDQRAAVYTSLGDAYTADYREDQASNAYAHAWQLLGDDDAARKFADPRPISATKELNRFQHAFTEYFVPKIKSGSDIQFSRLSDLEVPNYNGLPPQKFTVRNEAPARYQINDRHIPEDNLKPAQRVIGKPFQFLRGQLAQIIPRRTASDAALAKLAVQLDFTVDRDGRATNVAVSGSHIPWRLANLMQRVVSRTRFRPRMVDGKPVTTKHVKLVQTFE